MVPRSASTSPPDTNSMAKGMAVILEERGINMKGLKLNATCGNSGFKCWFNVIPPGSNPCCCRKALYDQPNFTNQASRVSELLESLGHKCTYYARFHCKCNFIESNWGYLKRVYCEFPLSEKEEHLESNVKAALDLVPLVSMHWYVISSLSFVCPPSPTHYNSFANRSLRFMDAYRKGLNGSQAAWANKKYCGHCVLPKSLMADMERELK